MCAPFGATSLTGLLHCVRNDSRFFVHVSPADFVLAATFAYRSVLLRASVAMHGNPVVLCRAQRTKFELCTLASELYKTLFFHLPVNSLFC